MTFLLFVLENKLFRNQRAVGSPRAFPGLTFTLFPSHPLPLLSFQGDWRRAGTCRRGRDHASQLPLYLAQHLLLTKSFMVLYPWYELQEEEAQINTTLCKFPESDTGHMHTHLFFFHPLKGRAYEPLRELNRQQVSQATRLIHQMPLAQLGPLGFGSSWGQGPWARMWQLLDQGS